MSSITDSLRCYYNSNMKEKTPLELERENRILQSNWNSLREDIQHKKDILDKDQAFRFNHETKFKLSILNYVLDKMNELESSDNK